MAPKLSAAASAPQKMPTAAWKRTFARNLLAWYRRHQRDLPWRRTRDPYAIWVSEVMLQQTQVSTVVPYFERFMAAFPTIRALAAADEHAVLRLWEGLGYYRRAQSMHRAARVMVEQHGGQFPRDAAAVGQLPGIGRYTVGAVLSIAFDEPAPILEANTARLFSRLIAFRGDPASSAGQRLLWQLAEAVLPVRDCGAFNSALMELGSQVCTPRAPRCDACPVHQQCAAFALGAQARIPRPRPKQRFEAVREAAVVVWRGGKVLLRQRPPGERWAGLWDFLRFPLAARDNAAVLRELALKIRAQSGLNVRRPQRLATLKHGVTRFRITLECYEARCASATAKPSAGTWRWVEPGELPDYALSTTGRKLSRLLLDGVKP